MSASPNGSVTGMGELCTIHADIQQFLMKSSNPQLPLFIGLSSIGRFILFSSGYEPLDAAIQSIACESSNRANPPPSNRHGTLLFIRYLIAGYSLNVQLQFITEAGKDLNILCPFILDQFYWAERLHWMGVAPEPLRSWHLFPDNDDATSISQAAECLARAIKLSLSPEVKAQASKVADRISSEVRK
ncbi:hypothetical protein B296_00012794 [Ensete ventricosum]|uniref:Uncharacterized protein n=1 Tax=Ensete ventricosum TaxID=4639 RepID=A0A427B8Y3_ENSVE|nr:hypothetical protein B296_00012794 [Ensete ventricosum]